MILRFYEQFSRSSRNLGHFWKFEKISNSWNTNISNIILKRVIWRFQIYNFFAKFLNAFVKTRNLNFSRNKLYIWDLQITRFKMIYHTFLHMPRRSRRTLCQSIRDSTVQSTGADMGSKACNENSISFSVQKNILDNFIN